MPEEGTDKRTQEQLRRHFEVERELARRLLNSKREERSALLPTLYNELFERVPDHPRLQRRDTEASSRKSVAARMRLLEGHLRPEMSFLEFAPGDCRLAFEVCSYVRKVIAVDISDQSGSGATVPSNFELIVFDGYKLDLPDQCADLVFSYQFLEHLHPDDVELHLSLAYRLLKPGGSYVFDTPHRYSGPHDISKFFTDTPQGFHLKEWTYAELFRLLRKTGFTRVYTYRAGKQRRCRLCNAVTLFAEALLGVLPRGIRRRASSRLFQSVAVVALK